MSYKQQHTDIKQIIAKPTDYVGKIVTICGWIKTFRAGKKNSLGFCKLNDGTCVEQLQILFDKSLLAENHKTYFDQIFEKATTGVSLKVIGPIVPSPKAEQPVELQAHSYEILGEVQDPETYPIAKTELGLDFLRTVPHLRVRTDTFASVNRIKSVMKLAFAEYFDQLGFHEVQVPLITDNECESGANPFTVTTVLGDGKVNGLPVKPDDKNAIDFHADFFRKRTYLTVSGQLHLEAIVLAGLQKAYCLTLACRAEPSTGKMHLGEFWMLELEFCFCKLEDNMTVNEGAIKYCIQKVLSRCKSELTFLQNKFDPTLISKLEKYVSTPFIRTTHEKCVQQMLTDQAEGKVKFIGSPKFDDDLSREHERYITDVMYGGLPVFVQFYPASVKAFYMPKINEGAQIERVQNFDLLAPGLGEITGGSQRETNYDKLIERMKEMNVKPESLEFYSDLRKYGTVPHGGSGIGFDRLVMLMTSMENIRDCVPFPRSYETCQF